MRTTSLRTRWRKRERRRGERRHGDRRDDEHERNRGSGCHASEYGDEPCREVREPTVEAANCHPESQRQLLVEEHASVLCPELGARIESGRRVTMMSASAPDRARYRQIQRSNRSQRGAAPKNRSASSIEASQILSSPGRRAGSRFPRSRSGSGVMPPTFSIGAGRTVSLRASWVPRRREDHRSRAGGCAAGAV